MARITKAELQAENKRLRMENGALYLAVSLPRRMLPRLLAQETFGDTVYTLRAYGLSRADGGVVIVETKVDGQNPFVQVEYAETWATRVLARKGLLDEAGCFVRDFASRVRSAWAATPPVPV